MGCPKFTFFEVNTRALEQLLTLGMADSTDKPGEKDELRKFCTGHTARLAVTLFCTALPNHDVQ